MKHGTHVGYGDHGCRCEACRGFMAFYRRSQRGTRTVVTLYEDGSATDHPAFVRLFTQPKRVNRASIHITQQGREYLAAMKGLVRS